MIKLVLAIRKPCHHPREGLKFQLAFSASITKYNLFKKNLKSQLTFFALTTNHCYRFKEGLETQLTFTTSTSSVIDFDNSNITSSNIESSRTGYSL